MSLATNTPPEPVDMIDQAGEVLPRPPASIGPRAWIALGMLFVVYVLNFLSRQ